MLVSPAEQAQEAVQIAPMEDVKLIAETLGHPRIFPHIHDDACKTPEDLKVFIGGPLLYLGAYEGPGYLGLFATHPHNLVTYEIHTCLLPRAWGEKALRAARAVVAWLFENTPCRRLITSVPEGNDLALHLAIKAGLIVYGVNPSSFMRHGQLLDQTLLGVSKG
jgi:RimJ/RimL family protein N-acetyltransferase